MNYEHRIAAKVSGFGKYTNIQVEMTCMMTSAGKKLRLWHLNVTPNLQPEVQSYKVQTLQTRKYIARPVTIN